MHFITTPFTYHIIHINLSLAFCNTNCRNLRIIYHRNKNSCAILIK
nr:MAG TPA: hypothetical protein [Caudoviricetes sp.]